MNTDIYRRRRMIAICSIAIMAVVIVAMIVWNVIILHIVQVDPANGTLPTTQQTITIQYSQKLVDAKITSFTPQVDYTTSVKDDRVTIHLATTQKEGSKLAIAITATGVRSTLNSQLSFTAAYVDFNKLSEAQQTQLINESDGISDARPLAGLIPHIDVAGPYSIEYGDTAPNQIAASLVISDSSPNGRAGAIQWIRSQGVDPTILDIRYDEYINPLTSGDTQ